MNSARKSEKAKTPKLSQYIAGLVLCGVLIYANLSGAGIPKSTDGMAGFMLGCFSGAIGAVGLMFLVRICGVLVLNYFQKIGADVAGENKVVKRGNGL